MALTSSWHEIIRTLVVKLTERHEAGIGNGSVAASVWGQSLSVRGQAVQTMLGQSSQPPDVARVVARVLLASVPVQPAALSGVLR